MKILAKLDVAEHRRPQDGHFRVSVQHGARRYPIDFRVNVLPGSFGEDTVLRVLGPDVKPVASPGIAEGSEFSNSWSSLKSYRSKFSSQPSE